ncbi:folate/biopterin family MFS transporter [Candidatus Peribacteria bacterium]|jgi:folate/biopterin transporter|nr:folate/biopterin family MFS transporter [Candidatus Peribacteria bacterium]MBT4021263.1 folate/biopterin family MFS transporter [Candidatus Peribacteria bacterium]MBT4240672.1 folate/biopterin family MFS transporter [Candidatus Peribacteria bacterium]MBT4474017.1 folate/biopterin family MFS transporter [Candidatus Peribacteria bacterium]
MNKRDLTNIIIPFVYFIAGSTALAGVATTFYYKEDLGLTVPQVGILGSISLIPWSIKPIYGIISDRVPVYGFRRRPYLFLSGILGAIGYYSLATWVQSFYGAFIAVFISAMGFALADVIVDGIVAERSKTQKIAGRLQSICRASLLSGALAVSYLSGVLVEKIGARNVFYIVGTLPLLTCIFSVFISEKLEELQKFSILETWRKFKNAVTPALIWSVFFLFVWRATPSSGGAFNYFLIDELKFSPEFFGRLALISYASGIVGVLIFRKYLISIPLRTLFFWIIIASVVLSMPSIGLIYGWYEYIGVSARWFAMADTLVSGPLTEIGFLPLLVLAARICPKGIEATMFAVFASIMNIGLAVSDLGGAWLSAIFDVRQATEVLSANYDNLDKVLWIAILSSFLPMIFLRKLPDTRVSEEVIVASGSRQLATSLEPEKREIV